MNFSFSEKISCFKWSALMEMPIFDDFPKSNPALFSGGSMSSRPLPERQDPDRWSPRPGIDGKKDIFFTKKLGILGESRRIFRIFIGNWPPDDMQNLHDARSGRTQWDMNEQSRSATANSALADKEKCKTLIFVLLLFLTAVVSPLFLLFQLTSQIWTNQEHVENLNTTQNWRLLKMA